MSVRVTELPSGLRIVTDEMSTVETVSIGVWVDSGARHENEKSAGISHLVEHMAFKGTRTRTARQIAEEIETVGGHLNAYTSRENTAFYAKVLKEDAPLAVDILSDILLNPTLDEDELAREKSVIIQEIHQANDTPDDVIFDFFQEAAFPGHPLGRPILGTVDNVKGFARRALIDHMENAYRPDRMVFAAAGNIGHDRFVQLVGDPFPPRPTAGVSNGTRPDYRGGQSRHERDLEQVHMVLGFEGVSFDDPDYYPLAVFASLMGGGMSSRLFQEIRENRGLAYNIYCFPANYADCGLFGIYAGTGRDEAAELLPLIADQLKLSLEEAGAAEIDRARAQMKAGLLMGLESTTARCEQAARQLQIYGRILPVPEMIERIDAVDAAAVAGVARRLIDSPPTLAAIGPIGRLAPVETVAARLGAG